MRRSLLTMLALPLALLAVACADGSGTEPLPTNTGTAQEAQATSDSPAVVATGTFAIPAANAFGEPGFHAPVVVNATVPLDVDPASGRRLVLSLRDSSRPGQSCSQQHPLSGCVTVDWSDGPSRPNVPPDGVFDNHLALSIGGVRSMLFLHEDGQLGPEPERFDPG